MLGGRVLREITTKLEKGNRVLMCVASPPTQQGYYNKPYGGFFLRDEGGEALIGK